MRNRNPFEEERGASAVEFAFIVTLLVTLVLGIAEFSHAFHVQSTLSSAAREGVRQMALTSDPSRARAAVRAASSSLDPGVADAHIQITPTACPRIDGDSTSVRLTIRYPMPFMTHFFGSGITLTGTGVMRCNG